MTLLFKKIYFSVLIWRFGQEMALLYLVKMQNLLSTEVAHSFYATCIALVCTKTLWPKGELKLNFFVVFESCFGIYGFVLFFLTVCEPIKMNSLVCQCKFQNKGVPCMMNLCSYCHLMNSNVQHSQRISSSTSSNGLVNLTKWRPFLTFG